MKIFDWVHQRMHTNFEYCRVPRHKKGPYFRDGSSEDYGEKKVETEKQALLMGLHHVTSIQQVLDGILTIGTLGHLEYHCQKGFLDVDPHAHQEFQPVPSAHKEEPEEAEEEKEEEAEAEEPAEVAVSAAHPSHNLATESFKKEMLEILDIKNGSAQNIAEEAGDLLEPLLKAIKDNRRERITLADLFLAAEDDPANKANPNPPLVAPASARVEPEKQANGPMEMKAATPPRHAKHSGSSLAKKLTPWKKGSEDSPPATKILNRMIRRMMNKKIHPEMARDVNASMQACRRSKSPGESASLI